MENNKDNDSDNSYCPSYAVKPGAKLYGIVNENGFINYLKSPIEINQDFIEEAYKGREPEKRFRFAGNCSKSGCNQWNGTSKECGLVDQLIDIIGNEESIQLQDCPIRSKCRWFSQRKGHACAQCNEVIRDIEMKIIGVD
jgi:hypothetical protein